MLRAQIKKRKGSRVVTVFKHSDEERKRLSKSRLL